MDLINSILKLNEDPNNDDLDGLYLWYVCNSCKSAQIRSNFNYCPMCGIKIK